MSSPPSVWYPVTAALANHTLGEYTGMAFRAQGHTLPALECFREPLAVPQCPPPKPQRRLWLDQDMTLQEKHLERASLTRGGLGWPRKQDKDQL